MDNGSRSGLESLYLPQLKTIPACRLPFPLFCSGRSNWTTSPGDSTSGHENLWDGKYTRNCFVQNISSTLSNIDQLNRACCTWSLNSRSRQEARRCARVYIMGRTGRKFAGRRENRWRGCRMRGRRAHRLCSKGTAFPAGMHMVSTGDQHGK